MTLGNDNVTDGQTDGQTDRRTDRQSATQYAAPPREEGRIISLKQSRQKIFSLDNFLGGPPDIARCSKCR